MAREPIGSMMENVPSQLNEEELAAEVEVEMPETLDMGPVPDNVEMVVLLLILILEINVAQRQISLLI